MERRKYIGKPYKDYYKSYSIKVVRIDEISIKGFIAYTLINEVNRPLIVGDKGNEICLADNGYSEIVYLPDNENWKLCAMYNNEEKIIEWYFDITKKNTVDNIGKPYCDDLYLDIVLMPNGNIIVLDEDELKKAYEDKLITKNDYNFAYTVKEKLITDGILKVKYLEELCTKLFELVTNKNSLYSEEK